MPKESLNQSLLWKVPGCFGGFPDIFWWLVDFCFPWHLQVTLTAKHFFWHAQHFFQAEHQNGPRSMFWASGSAVASEILYFISPKKSESSGRKTKLGLRPWQFFLCRHLRTHDRCDFKLGTLGKPKNLQILQFKGPGPDNRYCFQTYQTPWRERNSTADLSTNFHATVMSMFLIIWCSQ